MAKPEEMAVGLESDFIDYYDHHFCSRLTCNVIFKRLSTNSLSRLAMFKLLHDAKMPVPMHGPIEAFAHTPSGFTNNDLFVVYFDEYGHRGEGKQVMPLAIARELYPNRLASKFVGEFGPPSISYRFLRIGSRGWLLKYTSDHPWASNCGNVTIEIVRELGDTSYQRLRFPLYAVDMVEVPPESLWWGPRRRPHPYFVDLNLSPQIKGTGIEAKLKASEAVRLITEAIESFGLPKY